MKIFVSSMLAFTFLFTFSAPKLAMAQDIGSFLESAAGEKANLQDQASATEIIGSIISIVLGLLGVVFLGLLIYAGILWMTAQGNEERVKKAQDILKQSIIGLVITLAAYAIASFVVENLQSAATGQASSSININNYYG